MVSPKLTALMMASAIMGRTFSPPGSWLTMAISAEASSTYLGKGRVLVSGLAQGVNEADALGYVTPGQFLGLPDRFIERRDLNAVLRPAENDFLAVFDVKCLSHLGR